jgi:hypothetical protein
VSAMSLAFASLRGLGAPRRVVATRLLFLVGVLIVALIASVLPAGSAAESFTSPNSTFYAINGKCYVEHKMNTTMDEESVDIFRRAMDDMLSQLGHESNYTFSNGTLTLTATTTCPPDSGKSLEKTILKDWTVPALGVAAGLLMVVAFSSAVKYVYYKIAGHELGAQSRLTYAVTALGGLMATFITSYTASWRWEPSLSSGITAIFTTYLVAVYGFQGLQDIARDWITAGFNLIFLWCTGPFLRFLGTDRDLEVRAITDMEQANA